eukprot:XP_016658180.1 PREDICTED: uncharacterized protein LOC107883161 [Acyrthosiphon pisum]
MFVNTIDRRWAIGIIIRSRRPWLVDGQLHVNRLFLFLLFGLHNVMRTQCIPQHSQPRTNTATFKTILPYDKSSPILLYFPLSPSNPCLRTPLLQHLGSLF